MKEILIVTLQRKFPEGKFKNIIILIIQKLFPSFLIDLIYNLIYKPIKYARYPFLISGNKNISNVFTKIYKTKFWISSESNSGPGSEKEATKFTRKEIKRIINKYNINSILDIPCGDCNWIEPDSLGIKYIGADIVKEVIEENKLKFNGKIDFRVLDLTTDILPKTDLIFCRECLQHLSTENIFKALKNIKNSEAQYLLVTSHKKGNNVNINNGEFFPIDLDKPPFSLGNHIDEIEEIDSNVRAIRNNEQYLFLYKIDSINIG